MRRCAFARYQQVINKMRDKHEAGIIKDRLKKEDITNKCIAEHSETDLKQFYDEHF